MSGRRRKLTDAQAEEIREWYALRNSIHCGAEIAKKYGIADSLVYQIGRGLVYKTQHRSDRAN